jgi:HPt (histidine-containing phosphotransfer) domain-containing protein
MPRQKATKPLVATYGDYEIINPPNSLLQAASMAPDADARGDPVERAEAALAALSGEFPTWMDDEVARLDKARREVKAKGFTEAARDRLFHAAHDIKGEAATFGFPWVAASAESLCRLIEHTPDIARIPLALVDQHVDAVRAIMRESKRADIDTIADALSSRLREVTADFLTQQNRGRPEAVAATFAPPLAPENG